MDSAGAVFFLGVLAIQRHQYALALQYMKLAHELNPGHEETARQVAMLEELLSETVSLPPPSPDQ